MKQCSDTIPIQKSLKQGETLSPLLFNFASEFSIRKNHANRRALKERNVLPPDFVNYGSLLSEDVHTMKNTQHLSVDSRVFQRFFFGETPIFFFKFRGSPAYEVLYVLLKGKSAA
jgi:hypothetical protein